ncbi:hypothetical protein F5148DRAFT_1158808 [Russula earlei]|uniref:Uncharacterized protein n=1 Tax=Russula earlei TaxID=71964 RepID=A0ACC0UN22_9AGAM|nr:hypothetical protein F5148DRAFT_1158808 [Russula earlei]
MRTAKFAAIFCLAIGIIPSFALPSGDAPNLKSELPLRGPKLETTKPETKLPPKVRAGLRSFVTVNDKYKEVKGKVPE